MKDIEYMDICNANEAIKTTDIKGKEYAEVNQRIKAFRMLYPMGFIRTNLLSNENGVCVIKAEVGFNYMGLTAEGHNIIKDIVIGTGIAYEKEGSTFINKTSYIENCETSAVGRALGMAGIGIDTSVASAEEVQTAIINQTANDPIDSIKVKALKERCKNDGVPEERVLQLCKVKKFEDITNKFYANICENWKKVKESK